VTTHWREEAQVSDCAIDRGRWLLRPAEPLAPKREWCWVVSQGEPVGRERGRRPRTWCPIARSRAPMRSRCNQGLTNSVVTGEGCRGFAQGALPPGPPALSEADSPMRRCE